MRPLYRRNAFLLILLLLAARAPAFEVGTSFVLSNLDFARDRASTDSTLPGDNSLWGLTVTGAEQLSDVLSLELRYENDPVLRNVGYTLLTYTDRFFSLRLGPFFGIFNSPDTILQSGLSTTVRLFVQGIAQITLRSDNSLSGRLVVTGDYIQEQSELSVGFYAPNVIPTAYVRSRRYTTKTAAGEDVNSMVAYGLETDIFEKNIPYQIVLDFAYQGVTRTFVEADTTVQSYGSLILGTRATLTLFDTLSIVADLDTSIYTFGLDSLIGEVSADRFLFRLSTGVSYRF
jgi:hypothetical protein